MGIGFIDLRTLRNCIWLNSSTQVDSFPWLAVVEAVPADSPADEIIPSLTQVGKTVVKQ